ncbi:MAG: hypothetical protein QOG82_2555, partial [Actinomycetota bacterium]|nr:hypothetical protein [Actinomycetota bacterium]
PAGDPDAGGGVGPVLKPAGAVDHRAPQAVGGLYQAGRGPALTEPAVETGQVDRDPVADNRPAEEAGEGMALGPIEPVEPEDARGP